ncbi:hypothetical protein LY474_40355 [Myxococcus stipitatus]|uniref:hypothetical protein n=1 Tax=Myxococcus stipitatus TaxID=83455 RepID=UPI001F3C09C1|nr:hypothetical protein [Myxococcus stipitatus]MCE9674062.1 hypothetical protein [Myxococcus stipitatus]
MASMFEAMARHRPEWLAQGILMRAVETEPAVRALMIEQLRENLPCEEVPGVTEEEVTEGGWRADVCVAWKKRTARLELKLLAGFTRRQEEALKRREVDLLVLPSKEGVKSRIVCSWFGGGLGEECSLVGSSSGSVWG